MTPAVEDGKPVTWPRTKIVLVVLIGCLIAFNARSDVELVQLLGSVWGPRARTVSAIALGGFYALEKYLARTPRWWKDDADADKEAS